MEVESRASPEEFEFDQLLGEGGFVKVFLVRPKDDLLIREEMIRWEAGGRVGGGTEVAAGTRGGDVLRAMKVMLSRAHAQLKRRHAGRLDNVDSLFGAAMKVMAKSRVVAGRQVEHIQQERKLLQRVNYPFIVRLQWAF